MAEEDDLITIVDVTDPDDPSYSDVKTKRRYLTELELASLKLMLERVGAYKFFSAEFNFADGPAVKQFIETVELEEFKRCKQRKIVQESMKGVVAGREVVIDADLIEKAFGLVDDGENIIKPKGETHGLHAFYIKPKYAHLCQNYRGVYLKLFKSEYSYFVNMAHQIQTYCCGGTPESQITLTQYRAIDLMVRGKPVNWNRYLMQNFQDKLRKYKTGPCSLYFGGTLTALIYKALHVDYNLVNKPLLIPPQTPERLALPEATEKSKSSSKKKENASGQKLIKAAPPSKKREPVKREVGAMTRAQRMLSPDPEAFELQLPPSKKANRAATAAALKGLERKRKRIKEEMAAAAAAAAAAAKRQKSSKGGKRVDTGKQQQKPVEVEDDEESEPSGMHTDETEDDMPGSPLSLPPSPPRRAKSPATAPAAIRSRGGAKTAEPRTPATAPPPLQALFTPETTPYSEGGVKKRVADVEKLGGEIVLSTATNRLSKLFAYATSEKKDGDSSFTLTGSTALWTKYDHLFSLQHEQQLEHIVSKVMLEQSLEKIQELESALKEKDREISELRSKAVVASEAEQEQQAPLKIRLKVGQKKVSAEVPGDDNGDPMETDAQEPVETQAAGEDQPEKSSEVQAADKQPGKSPSQKENNTTTTTTTSEINHEKKSDGEKSDGVEEKTSEPDNSNDAAAPAAGEGENK